MPKILELKEINGELWARIPFEGSEPVTLWTETEKKAALVAERERCMQALLNLGSPDETD